jgi:hypothetical protein
MRKPDPLAVTLALSVLVGLASAGFIAATILLDRHPTQPVPYSTDLSAASETRWVVAQGERAVQP